MCKALFYKGFSLIFLISTGLQSLSQSIEQLYNTKSLDFVQLVDKNLYQPALNISYDQDVYEEGLIDAIDIRKKELLSKLKVNHPEMLSDLVNYDRSLLKDYDISNVLLALIKRQSAQGITPKGMNIMQYASSMGLDAKECAELQFFHGYELFKQKRFIEAIGAFEQTIKTRSQDSHHAHYYSAMSYLLMSDYDNSLVHLQKINKDLLYKNYVPYYASLGQYAKGDYEVLIKTYASTASYQNIYNKSGLAKILAFSSYNLGKYKEAIAYLNNQNPKNDENTLLLLTISYNQLQQYNQTATITQTIKPENNAINERLRFESAFAFAELGQMDKALYNLNDLIPSSLDVDVLRWNIAVLLHRKGDYQGALNYTKPLLNSKLKNKAQDLLTVLADELDDTALIADLASEIGQDQSNVAPIINNLYGKALALINKGNWNEASKPINTLKQIAPNSREYSQIQVLKGIKEYNDGNLLQAKMLLNGYTISSYASEVNEFSIQCYYYLGYTYFKSREPKKALGYFAKSLDLCKSIQSWNAAMSYRDDLYIRLGDVHLLNNDLKNAAEAYKVIVDSKGKNTDYALYQLALVSELKGENYDQIILLKDLISNYPTSTLRFKAEYSCANTLFDLGKYAQAEEHYQRIVKMTEDIRMRDLSIMQIGLINVNAGDYGKAANLYNQLIANSKDVALKNRAKEALKEIYSQYDINTEAYVALAIGENNEKTPDQIIWQLANENMEYGKYKIAIDQLNKLINDHPQSNNSANARYKLADIYLKSENIPSAVSAYITAIKTHPENSVKTEAAITLSQLLFKNKAFNKEYLTYSELGWFSTNQEETVKDLYRRTLLQYEFGQYDKVVKGLQSFDSAKVPSTQKEEIALKLLQNSLTSKDWNAITALHENLPDIQSPKWIYSVALAQMNQDQYDISISTITDNYDSLLKDSGWLVKSMLLLSDIYFIKGDKTSAIAALESIIKSDLNIPPGIKQQVTDRLNDLNL